MRIYLAGETENPTEHNVPVAVQFMRSRLFSYHYIRERAGYVNALKLYTELGKDMFLDCGAYSAFTQGVEISIEEYAAWINENGHMFTTMASLDDTSKNEQLSYDNLKALESLGCKVQPVFHAREDPAWLVKYLDEGYDYIFIGGLVPESTNWLLGWLDDLFARYLLNADGTPRVKLHGFGLTDQKLMFRYPWFSVDSTSWVMVAAFGGVLFFDEQAGRLVKVLMSGESPAARKWNGWHYETMTPEQKARIDGWLAPMGITAQECAEHYLPRQAVNAKAYRDAEVMGVTTFKVEQGGLF